MSTRKRNKCSPDNSIHPGEMLREMLSDRGIVQRRFAKEIGIAPSYLCDFLKCRRGAAPRLALRLEAALDVSAEFWLTMQMHHDLATAREALNARKTRKP
jgi:addiction module HigA family antidote